ncbi:MAG: ribosome-associated translation inhibitor RaiA [Firmicutes bacterium]|nr:ribosome-associated translation inhibitor RaiA [Bacillota bacterium]
MIIEIISRNYTPQERLKTLITEKINRLDKFFDPNTKVKAVLKATKAFSNAEIFSLELTITHDGALMRAEVSDRDAYSLIDIALPKLEKQIVKHRNKLAGRFKKFDAQAALSYAVDNKIEDEDKAKGVVKSKTYNLKPMTIEDAIEEQELVGHSFFVFLNKVTGAVNVLYKRNDGDYGLIETIAN